eukprot:9146564-Prorocentrum_lima.AAC.1
MTGPPKPIYTTITRHRPNTTRTHRMQTQHAYRQPHHPDDQERIMQLLRNRILWRRSYCTPQTPRGALHSSAAHQTHGTAERA